MNNTEKFTSVIDKTKYTYGTWSNINWNGILETGYDSLYNKQQRISIQDLPKYRRAGLEQPTDLHLSITEKGLNKKEGEYNYHAKRRIIDDITRTIYPQFTPADTFLITDRGRVYCCKKEHCPDISDEDLLYFLENRVIINIIGEGLHRITGWEVQGSLEKMSWYSILVESVDNINIYKYYE